MTYSAIVPTYNENPRVLEVLRVLQRCTKISEIICVDDGSTDGSAIAVKQEFGNIIVLQHSKNLGKLQAVRTGIKLCNNKSIILMDSDLKNIIPEEIDRATAIFEKNNLDCLLLCTKPTSINDRLARYLFRLAHVATGCRIIKKEVLKRAINNTGRLSYHLEPAQNKYLMENSTKVAYVNISAVGILKSEKVGFIKGLLQEIEMWRQVLSYSGIIFNIRQVLLFARKKERL